MTRIVSSERGVALVLALMAMLLLSGLGLALVVAANPLPYGHG